MFTIDARDELPPNFVRALSVAPAPAAPLSVQPVQSAQPVQLSLVRDGTYTEMELAARGPHTGVLGGSYTNLFEGGEPARHAYMNRTLDLDPVPLASVGTPRPERRRRHSPVPARARPEATVEQSAPAGLSASRLRLLHDTTMIDAALDLDEPEPPPHLAPLPHVGVHSARALAAL